MRKLVYHGLKNYSGKSIKYFLQNYNFFSVLKFFLLSMNLLPLIDKTLFYEICPD